MIRIGKTNYKNSIVNFTSSLMKYYGIKSNYESHALVDFILSKKYKHVALILLDGMGSKIIDNNLGNGSILKTHQIITLNSVYPPTTVAATTAFTTGVAPIESGWLGWHLYLNEEDPSIVLFRNVVNSTGEPFEKFRVNDVIPSTEFYKNTKKAKGYEIYPSFREGGAQTFKEAVERLQTIFEKDEANFTYLYWNNPDELMHEYGTTSQIVRTTLFDIEDQIQKLADNIPNDTVVFITADHGMVDVEPIELNKYPDFVETLRKPFAGEGRFAQFYVKEGFEEKFVELFNNLFADSFKLFNKEEFINSKLSGLYEPNEIVKYALGDYIAVAISNYYFSEEIKENDILFRGHHAGLTKEEMEIPIILLKRKDEDIED